MPRGVDWAQVLQPQTPLLEILGRGSLTYLAIFIVLRVVLKRQSGQLGLSDMLVLVLIADASQNAMADDYRSVTDGVVLVLVIVGWAWLVDFLGYRFPAVERLVRPRPLPLIRHGRVIRANLRREFVSDEELMSQLRLQGIEDVAEVERAAMEPNGHLSVVRKDG